jgi:hypothetical protein
MPVGTRRPFKSRIGGRVASGALLSLNGFYDRKKPDAKVKLNQPAGKRLIALPRAIETNAQTAANQEFR